MTEHPDCLHDCIFLICDTCGTTNHLDDDRLASRMRDVAAQAGFAAERPVLEMPGAMREVPLAK